MQLRAATIHEYSSIRTRTRSYCFTWPGPRWFGGRKPAIRSAFAVFLARAAISARELSSQVEIALSTHLLCFGDSSCPLTVSMGSSLRQASKGSLTERSLGSQEDWPTTLSGSCTYREWKPCKKNGQTKPECAGLLLEASAGRMPTVNKEVQPLTCGDACARAHAEHGPISPKFLPATASGERAHREYSSQSIVRQPRPSFNARAERLANVL